MAQVRKQTKEKQVNRLTEKKDQTNKETFKLLNVLLNQKLKSAFPKGSNNTLT